MAITPDTQTEVNTLSKVDFLSHLGGEFLAEQDVVELRRLSHKYQEIASLRFALLGEIDVENTMFIGSPERLNPVLVFLRSLQTLNEYSQNDGKNSVYEEDEIAVTNLLNRISTLVNTESSLLIQWYTEKSHLSKDEIDFGRIDIVGRYNDLLNQTRLALGGDLNRPRKRSVFEAEKMAEDDTKSKFDGMSEIDPNRKKYKERKLFQYLDENSSVLTNKKSDKDQDRELKRIHREVNKCIKSWLKERFTDGRTEERKGLLRRINGIPEGAEKYFEFDESSEIKFGPSSIEFSVKTSEESLKGFNGRRVSLSLSDFAVGNIHYDEIYRNQDIGYNGYYYIFALSELSFYLDSKIKNAFKLNILNTPLEWPLLYFTDELYRNNYDFLKPLFRSENLRFNAQGVNVLVSWFCLTRYNGIKIRHPFDSFDTLGQFEPISKLERCVAIVTERKNEEYNQLSSKKSFFSQFRELGFVLKSNRVVTEENIDVSTAMPTKDGSASLIDQAIPKPVSFEIDKPWDLDIEYLTAYPDDDKPLKRYELPSEIIGKEHSLRSKRAVPVENRRFRIWAPVNSKITSFSLNNDVGREYKLGRDYELEVDGRGYYRASFKVGVSVPESVKYNFKFTIEPEKIDQVELDSQAILNLEIVTEKLDDAGYTNLADKLKSEIKKGKVKNTRDLEQIVLNSSLYYFSELYSPSTIESIRKNHFPFLPEPTDNGKVVMVCSHAALLMKSIMSDVFPSGETHSTSLLVLRRTPLGNRLYSTEDFHATLKGTVNGKNISLDATPRKPAIRFSTQIFRNIKEKFIEIYKRRKEGFMKAISKSMEENQFNTFVIVNEKTRKERQVKVNKQYFSGLLKTYIDTVASYEQAVTGTIKFKAPMAATDMSKLIMDFDSEFQKDQPDIATLSESVKEMKLRLKLSSEKVTSPNRKDVLDGKSYLGNATGYIGFLEGLVENLELRLR